MLDVCLLGTGGMMPLPYRYLTSLLVRLNGSSLLIDCGEGTQVALRKTPFSANPVDTILFTHFHGDHIGGLPGFLLTMGNEGRKEPLTLIGPEGLEKTVNALRIIAPELPFPIYFREIKNGQNDFEINGYHIHAFKVHHKIPCYAYSLTVNRLGKFNAEAAKEKKIPLVFWNRLQHGETVNDNGTMYTPDMVMGPARKGLKVVYATDTLPVSSISRNAANADLLIAEGMYGDPERIQHVQDHFHMMMQDACRIAEDAKVKELWLTHFSPAMTKPWEYEAELKEIFPKTVIPKDGLCKTLTFEDEE